eukprot:TRINITY_DN4977_c0_g1_i3.p1 TRINITY_DN4977_c0_g1~~TRINITY_DN4977_c0_g1_i3.p1  ORF type:complete len:775 (-),score=152.69 TRINITY_DN4977_c0_g1_i3:22-2346(-)
MSIEPLRVLNETHDGAVLCYAYHHFKREVYTGGQDAVIKVWDNESGKLLKVLEKVHTGWVTGIHFEPELRLLLSCSLDGRLVAYWSKEGKQGSIAQVLQTGTPLYCMEKVRIFMVDVEKLAEHDVQAGFLQERGYLQHHTDVVTCVVCVDNKVFTAGLDGRLCMYDAEYLKKEPRMVTRAHAGGITAIAFDGYNNCLATGSYDKTVRIWSFDLKLTHQYEVQDRVTGMCFMQPTYTLWVATECHRPTVLDLRSACDVTDSILPAVRDQHHFREKVVRLFWNNDSYELIGVTHRRHVIMWKYNPYGAVTVLEGHQGIIEQLVPINIKADKSFLVQMISASADGQVIRWEPFHLNNWIFTSEPLHEGDVRCSCVSYNRESNTLSAGFMDGVLRIWSYNSSPDQDFDIKYTIQAHGEKTDPKAMLVMAEWRHYVLTVGEDNAIRFWDTHQGHASGRAIENIHSKLVTSIAVSELRNEVATSSLDRTVKVWSCTVRRLVLEIQHPSAVNCVQWFDRNNMWVTASEDGQLIMWGIDGSCVQAIECLASISAFCVDEVSGYVVTANVLDKAIVVWDPEGTTTQPIATYKGHTDEIRCIIHLTERSQYASASWDKTIRLWNVPSVAARVDYAEIVAHRPSMMPGADRKPLSFAQRHPLVTPRALKQATVYMYTEDYYPTPVPENASSKHDTTLRHELQDMMTAAVAEIIESKEKKAKMRRRPHPRTSGLAYLRLSQSSPVPSRATPSPTKMASSPVATSASPASRLSPASRASPTSTAGRS